jgi:hypothetical protein
MLWAYAHTGRKALLDRALKAYEGYNARFPEHDTALKVMRSEKRGTEHGVTYNEIGKLGAVLFLHTGRRRFLDATVNAYRKLDRDQMLVDGVPSSTEALRGKAPLDSHETCDIADYTWSVGYLLMATGAVEYADKIERACFNAAPGAARTHDFGGLQYFSCPNQVVATRSSNHNAFFRGDKWMSYRPNPGTECCPGEVNRIMPNYAARMWMSGRQGQIVAALYGPSRVSFRAPGTRQDVMIVEETGYPFSEHVDFEVRSTGPARFSLSLRIPSWCTRPHLSLNGRPIERGVAAGRFVTLTRTFRPNDRVRLELPMDVRTSAWPGGGIAVERGPLVYSLPIRERWCVDREEQRATRDFPAWDLYPDSAWNYALAVDDRTIGRSARVVKGDMSVRPWTLSEAPISILLPARRVKGWRILRRKSVVRERPAEWEKMRYDRIRGDFLLTPPLPEPSVLERRLARTVETIRLVPYGCTHLRLTVFPGAPA